MTISIENQKLYRAMCEPVPLAEAALNSDRFFEGLTKLREECHIRDCLVTINQAVVSDAGEEGVHTGVVRLGDEQQGELLAAYTLGFLQHERQERIAAALSHAGTIKKGPRGR